MTGDFNVWGIIYSESVKEQLMNFFLASFRFVKDKTRPWRRRRHEIKNRLKELEKIVRLNGEISAWKAKKEILEQILHW